MYDRILERQEAFHDPVTGLTYLSSSALRKPGLGVALVREAWSHQLYWALPASSRAKIIEAFTKQNSRWERLKSAFWQQNPESIQYIAS